MAVILKFLNITHGKPIGLDFSVEHRSIVLLLTTNRYDSRLQGPGIERINECGQIVRLDWNVKDSFEPPTLCASI